MPKAPTPPKLKGENRGLVTKGPGAGRYQNDFLPWIQDQDPKKLVIGYGMAMFNVIQLIKYAFRATLAYLGQSLTKRVFGPGETFNIQHIGPYCV